MSRTVLDSVKDAIREQRPDLLGKLVAYKVVSSDRHDTWREAFDDALAITRLNVDNRIWTTVQGRFADRCCLFAVPLKSAGRRERRPLTGSQAGCAR